METTHQITEALEYMKASVPFFTLSGVIIGSFLTAILTKKQRKRDELFGYKVKAFVKLAESLTVIMQDYENGLNLLVGNEVAPFDPENYKGPLSISTFYQKVYGENYLFFDLNTRRLAKTLRDTLLFSSQLQLQKSINPDLVSHESLVKDITTVHKRCESLINHIYNEIGLRDI